FVVETDDEQRAHIRFGRYGYGMEPGPRARFRARYRIGNGAVGNVGRDRIVLVSSRTESWGDAKLAPRNPLPAAGGVGPDAVQEVRLRAPHAFRRVTDRAITAADYAAVALQETELAGAFGELAWNGSWYEAQVALDPLASVLDQNELRERVEARLSRARCIG